MRKATGNEIPTLFQEGYHVTTSGVESLQYSQIKWLQQESTERHKDYTIRDLVVQEDMFLCDDIMDPGTMKVEGIHIHQKAFGKEKVLVTHAATGLYKVTASEEDWADQLVDRLKLARREYNKTTLPPEVVSDILLSSRDWIADDNIIYGYCQEYMDGFAEYNHKYTVMTAAALPPPILIITDDRAMCNRIAEDMDILIIRVPIPFYLEREATLYGNKSVTEEQLSQLSGSKIIDMFADQADYCFPKGAWKNPGLALGDTGSFRNKGKWYLMVGDRIMKRIPLTTRYDDGYHRRESYLITPDIDKGRQSGDFTFEFHTPIVGKKARDIYSRYRGFPRPEILDPNRYGKYDKERKRHIDRINRAMSQAEKLRLQTDRTLMNFDTNMSKSASKLSSSLEEISRANKPVPSLLERVLACAMGSGVCPNMETQSQFSSSSDGN
jgi:hypothetical protein